MIGLLLDNGSASRPERGGRPPHPDRIPPVEPQPRPQPERLPHRPPHGELPQRATPQRIPPGQQPSMPIGQPPPRRGRMPLPQPTPRNGPGLRQPPTGAQPPPVRPWRQESDRHELPQPPAREDATMLIPRDRGIPRGSRWPMADPDVLRPYDELATRMLPRVLEPPPEPYGDSPPAVTGIAPKSQEKAATSLVKASGRIAIASLISRITGFLWKLMLAWAIGIDVANDSFNIANTFPNIVFELLLGGVLTSVVVPLLVRSQDDKDGGQEYIQRLM